MNHMPRRCFIIVNPTSGSYSQTRLDRITAGLSAGGFAPELLPTATPQDATLFAARICAENKDPLILAVGGDGTMNGVLNGLMPGAATLGVIPLGTSNVLARELNIDGVEDALKRVADGRTRSMTVGEIRCAGQTRLFLLMAVVGVDGAVVKGVRLGEKKLFGKGAYLLSALRVLLDWDKSRLRVVADGRSRFCHSVVACTAGRYGGNFLLAPQADISAPTLQVVCIEGGRLDYLKLGWSLVTGRFTASKSVEIFAATELELSGEKAVQLDGDFFGHAPLSIRALPGFLRLIV